MFLVFCDLYTSFWKFCMFYIFCIFWCHWQLILSICNIIFFHTSFLICSSCKKFKIEILFVDSEISQQSFEFNFIHAWIICWKIKSIYVVLTYLNIVCMNFMILVSIFTFFIKNVRCCNLSTASEILDLNCLMSAEIHSFFNDNVCIIFFSIFKSSIVCQFNAVSQKQTCRLFLIIVLFLSAATSQAQSVKT